jgi:serine/threonine protein phosphatase 1
MKVGRRQSGAYDPTARLQTELLPGDDVPMCRIIAVGDIHGCSRALQALLAKVELGSDDTLVTLGDYVDRGPDSRGVLDQLIELSSQCQLVPLLGNHESMMLSVLSGDLAAPLWKRFGGAETLASYNGKLEDVDPSHIEFMKACHLCHESDTHLFMHANYIAHLDLQGQPEQTLIWTHVSTVMPPPHQSGKVAVVGHTPQINGEILDMGHLVCIDTCCFAGGWLTAFDVETGKVWQANQRGDLR